MNYLIEIESKTLGKKKKKKRVERGSKFLFKISTQAICNSMYSKKLSRD